MYIFLGLLDYWQSRGVPVFELFRASPTFFSEESGEIALSVLTRSRPANMRCDYEQTRKSWLLVKEMFSISAEAKEDLRQPEAKKHHRIIGQFFY